MSESGDRFAADNDENLLAFLSAVGTAATAPSGTALPPDYYSGLAGTSPQSFLRMNRPWPALQQFDPLSQQPPGMSFLTQFPINSSPISSTLTSRELTFKMEALDRLRRAIDLIPMIDKIDLLAALQVAPDLVAKESDYLRFLRRANFDAKTAADKLVSYWKRRRTLFGDRAFRPMVMTGDGALTLEDVEIIKSGYIAYGLKDSEGCPIVIIDSSRVVRTPENARSRMRAGFYHAQYLSEDTTIQTEGFVALCIVNVNRFDRAGVEQVTALVNTFPVKVKSWHTFDIVKDKNSLEQGFLHGFLEVFLHSVNKVSTLLYSPEAMDNIAWELATDHGIPIESIPNFLGGTWTYDMFQQWFVERLAFEKNLYSRCPIDDRMSVGRQIHVSPRPHKRSKWGGEEKSLVGDDDDDAKPRAEKSPLDFYDSECVEGLLVEFQNLLLDNNSSKASAAHFTMPDEMHFELQPGRSSQDLLRFYGDKYDALEKALQAISVHDKVDYMTAVHVAPELVLQESDPSRFLSFHGYDAEKAAQGIVRYWKQRHELFGDRAFSPMTLTENGALNAEDIEFQKCGNLAVTGQDQQGSTVLVFDPSRRTTDDRNIRMRNIFYIWQVLFENPVNSDKGFVAIHIIRAPDYDKVIMEGFPMVLSLFPIKLKAMHTFDLMKRIDLFRRGFVQGLMGLLMSAYTATATFFHSPDHHHAEKTLCELELEHGLPRTVIPVCVGGSWNYDRFEEFQKERIMLERRRYPTLVNNATTILSQTLRVPGTVAGSSTTLSVRPPHHDANDAKLTLQEDAAMSGGQNNASLLLDGEARRLPAEETAAYFEAIRNAPQEIWADECFPELFLRVEECDVRKAAIRLTKYWQLRSLTFGTNQYALLTQTGDDALGRKELLALETGFLNLLPNDDQGRSVLSIDPSLLEQDVSQNVRHRCMFYMMSLMSENEKSQSDGAILIVRVDPQHFSLVDAPFVDALSNSLPLKINAVHFVSHENIPTDLIRSLGSLNAKVHVHSDQSKIVLLSKLESFGLTKAALPKYVNGEWGLEKFFQWQELRTRIEWRIPTCLSGRDCSLAPNFPAMKPYMLLPEDEAVERKRRMNAIHFRRKKNRFRVAVLLLKENCSDLQEEKTKLLRENQHLEAKYAKATIILSNLQASE